MYAETTAIARSGAPFGADRDPWLSLEQAAAELGVAATTVKSWTRPRAGKHTLRASRPGRGIWQFRRSWIDEFREACAPEPAPAQTIPAGHIPAASSVDPIRDVASGPSRARARRRRPTAGADDLPLIRR